MNATLKKVFFSVLAAVVAGGMLLAATANAATIAHYRFEQNFFDSGPNGLNGTAVGSLAFTNDVAPFPTTGSSALDATNDFDFVRVLDDPLLHLTGDLTVEAFVRPFNDLPGGGYEPHTIVGKQNHEGSGYFLDAYNLYYNQDTGSFCSSVGFGGNLGKFIESGSTFNDNEWHHVAMTYALTGDQATLSLYVDGNQEATDTFEAVPLYFGDDPLHIGAGNYGSDPDGTGYFRRNFIGYIDEVRISDVALSPGQFLNVPAPPACEGDFDGDGDVDGSDLAVFAADFGRTDCSPADPCEGDFDGDGDVDGSDLAVFAADFGRTDCP